MKHLLPYLVPLVVLLFLSALAGVYELCNPRPTPSQEACQVELVLTPATSVIRQMDPLFVKLALWNQTGKDATLTSEFQGINSGLEIQARRAGRGAYTPITSDWRTGSCVMRLQPYRKAIAPQRTCVAYEVVSSWYRPDVLANAGEYEVRAKVKVGLSRRVVYSDPVTITVIPIPDHERCLLTNVKGTVSRLFAVRPTDLLRRDDSPAGLSNEAARLRAVEQGLSDCAAKTTLRWKLALYDLRGARTGERHRAVALLKEIRDQLDPVTGEIIDLCLAKQYVEIHAWDEAAKVLGTIWESSEIRDELQRQVEEAASRGGEFPRCVFGPAEISAFVTIEENTFTNHPKLPASS